MMRSSGAPSDRAPGDDFGPLLPERTTDEVEDGWGERRPDADPHDLDRFLSERPPHHLD